MPEHSLNRRVLRKHSQIMYQEDISGLFVMGALRYN